MRISLLIPCHNEEVSLRRSIQSWLAQTRPPDEIIVVDDSSTDRTPEILKEFQDRIMHVRTPENLGNKSHAQQFGLQFVTGDIFIATDGDTILEHDFVARIEKDFADPEVTAVGGYVKSLPKNWITRQRAFDYCIGQNLYKLAQSYLNSMFVIPGAAGAFRTHIFRTYLHFDHDTITEDLDFTYKLHKHRLKIHYDRKAIVYTQDPSTLHCYINQIRRWYGGGWQNLLKHRVMTLRPAQALELTLMYVEGLVFSTLMFLIPLLNLRLSIILAGSYLVVVAGFSVYAALRERRSDLLLVPLPYLALQFVNAYVFIEQFVCEVIARRRQMVWFSPKRTA